MDIKKIADMKIFFLEKSKTNFKQGQVVLIITIFAVIFTTAVIFGVVTPIVRAIAISSNVYEAQKSYYLAEGGIEDVLYRIKKGKNVSLIEVLNEGNVYATTTITNVGTNRREVLSEGDSFNRIRKVKTIIELSTDAADFNYGIQSDNGGFVMENSSTVTGNVYSNGTVVGSGTTAIYGDVISAGPTGSISGTETTGSAYAHTITGSDITQDAYYQSISGTSVGGTNFPGSPDQATTTLPINDAQITEWENEAVAGGTITSPCPYIISTDTTLGPVKINCDLIIDGDPTITLNGAVWVKGNITISNTAIIRLPSMLGSLSTGMIADDPGNPTTKGRIILQNSTVYNGTGDPGSYVLMISQNKSAELGGGEKAIQVQNYASGDLLVYAGHGEIEIANNISLKQVTAYRIRLKNSANVVYETGLASLLFSSGPGGGWQVINWNEVE